MKDSGDSDFWHWFFPELGWAAFIVLGSPWVSYRVARHGHLFLAGVPLLLAGAGTWGFVWAIIRKRLWLAYLLLLAILIAHGLFLWWLPAHTIL